MKREEDEQLWDLLGKAETPAISPFFARNVVREVRQQRGWRSGAWEWISGRRALPAFAVALVLCTVATLTLRQHPGAGSNGTQDDVPDVVAQIDPGDYEVVANLDDLLASQEDDSWDDTLTL